MKRGSVTNDLLTQAHDARQQIAVSLPGSMLLVLRTGAWRRLVRPTDAEESRRADTSGRHHSVAAHRHRVVVHLHPRA